MCFYNTAEWAYMPESAPFSTLKIWFVGSIALKNYTAGGNVD
jgi:hypothetical protein